MSDLYIQYGCGQSAPESWLNFDASPTLMFERIPLLGRIYTRNAVRFPENVLHGDIVKGLPISPGAAAGVYCSHVLEHLAYKDLQIALRNTHELLLAEGVFRMVLPDLEDLAQKYLQSTAVDRACTFMRDSYLGRDTRPRSLFAFVREFLGNSHHLWMWDFDSMAAELSDAGFTHIRRAYFGDSKDARFSEVEVKARWDSCLGIECRK